MRIPSGKTDQLIFFVALDSADRVTRKTGLSSFTVYRSRNGGTATVYTTPTVAELSAGNMPGVYSLAIDEDTTIAAGSDSEEYCVHITQASMAPVTRTIELYRRDTTSGRTLDVSAGGEAGLDWANVGSPTTALALTGTTIASTQKVDVDTIKTNPVVNGGTITFPTTATLASTTNITAGTIDNVTTVNGLAAGVITAASIAADAITDAKVASDVTIASVTGSVGSVTGAVGSVTGAVGSVTGAVGSVASGGITAASFAANAINAAKLDPDVTTELQAGLATASALATVSAFVDTEVAAILAAVDTEVAAIKAVTDQITFGTANRVNSQVYGIESGAITATSIAADAIGASELAADAATEIATAVWALGTRSLTILDEDSTTLDLDATIRAAVGLASANLDTQIDALPTNAELATALGTADDAVLAAIAGLPAAPSAATIADAVWDEAISGHLTAGTTGAALNGAGGSGDPWATLIPGAYGAGTAGKILGDNINATVSSRATQTSVDDLPTNAELTTALGIADDAVLAAIDALPTNAELAVALGTADDAVLAQIALVKAKTDNLPSDPADASVVAGLIFDVEAKVDIIDTNVDSILVDTGTDIPVLIADLPTNAELATALGTADDAVLTALDDLPTNAELATALAGVAIDPVDIRSALGLATANLDTQLTAIDTEVGLIKGKTDSLTFTVSEELDVNIHSVNNTAVDGTGTSLDPWGPT